MSYGQCEGCGTTLTDREMLLGNLCDACREDDVCDGYPEHDYELFDEADGDTIYHCRRCGAELIETTEVEREVDRG